MFSRPGALYAGRRALPGEVRLHRERLSVVSYDRERTIGAVEQDFFFDDIATCSLTEPSWRRPRRTLRLDMLDGAVEHVWVADAVDSFAQLDAAFDRHRADSPLLDGTPPPNRSANIASARLGPEEPRWVGLGVAVLALAALGFQLFAPPGPTARVVMATAFVALVTITALRWRRARGQRRS